MTSWKQKKLLDREIQIRPWQTWFAWRPIKTASGRWLWRQLVYRKKGNTYVDYDNWTWYFYADEFDVLRYS